MIIDGDEDWRYSDTFGTLGRGNKHGKRAAMAAQGAPRKRLAATLAGCLTVFCSLLLAKLLFDLTVR